MIKPAQLYKEDVKKKYEADKWQEYKDLEEQGLLVRLSCKVGTEVFVILPREGHYIKCQIKKNRD